MNEDLKIIAVNNCQFRNVWFGKTLSVPVNYTRKVVKNPDKVIIQDSEVQANRLVVGVSGFKLIYKTIKGDWVYLITVFRVTF